ncbi:MAG: hypothetical protein L0H19_01385 [Salinisphaera sp.]|nr:hypothetical protein [Salinisphaera sp.]MDN5937432.1 hypothetical protein [Salinisphaera sp.]
MSTEHPGGMGLSEALLEQIRERCIQAALDGYEDAGMAGLCEEGRWEAAISAIRRAQLGDLADS